MNLIPEENIPKEILLRIHLPNVVGHLCKYIFILFFDTQQKFLNGDYMHLSA